MKRVMVACDSLGADWPRYGIHGYANLVARGLADSASVDVHTYGGKPLTEIAEDLTARGGQHFDVIVLHVGNPDIHPRLPHKPLKKLRGLGFGFCRERTFTIPPRFGVEWLLRAPLFLFRLVVIRLARDSYATVDEVIATHVTLTKELRSQTSRIIVLPLFEVSAAVYGPEHNRRANEINAQLAAAYGDDFLVAPVVTPEVYSRFYEADAFHFKGPYHDLLADHLMRLIQLG